MSHSVLAKLPIPDPVVSLHRTELNVILDLYGRMVAAGEWRDYGISMLKDVAIFSIFRRAAEHPIYRIEKRPKLRGRQGQYSVIAMDGQILKRGDDLKTVLRVLDKKPETLRFSNAKKIKHLFWRNAQNLSQVYRIVL